jgi:hypothetical protein
MTLPLLGFACDARTVMLDVVLVTVVGVRTAVIALYGGHDLTVGILFPIRIVEFTQFFLAELNGLEVCVVVAWQGVLRCGDDSE